MAVTRADLDDEFDEGEIVDEFGADESTAPWHNSTRAVVGASAAGIAVIGVLIAAVMLVSGGDDPADGPVNFVDPSFSETAVASSATTTTPTITSTPPVSTTEINAPTGPSSTTSGTSGTSDTSASSSESSGAPTFTRPRQRENDGDTGGPTSRTRPRLNVTRTLGPG